MTMNDKVNRYFGATARTFPAKVQEALRLIAAGGGSLAVQLLALRRYIRKAKDLDRQWVWSDEKIRSYKPSPAVQGEIDKVLKAFAKQNPGYSLAISPVRSLARQVSKWNHNQTVVTAGAALQAICAQTLTSYPDTPTTKDIDRFREFLGHASVHPEPTNAAPGLSDHGQMNAIDFVVMKGHQKVADTVTSTIGIAWDTAGWTQRLKDAVVSSNSRFQGPLAHPREPWHYTLPH